MIITLYGSLALIYVVLLGCLFIYALVRRPQLATGQPWFSLTIALAAVAGLIVLWSPNLSIDSLGLLLSLAVVAMLVTYGCMVINHLRFSANSHFGNLWLILGGIWWISLVIASQTDKDLRLAEADWIVAAIQTPDLPSLVLLGGLGIGSLILFGATLYKFFRAALSEVANQALYWVINVVIVWVGSALLLSGNEFFIVMGMVVTFVGMSTMLYASAVYRVFDMGRAFRLIIRNLVVLVLTTLMVFVALIFARTMATPASFGDHLFLGLFALLVAAAQIPIRKLIDLVFARVFRRHDLDVLSVTRQYSQRLNRAIELTQVITIATETLRSELGVKNVLLLLARSLDTERIEFYLPEGVFTEYRTGVISKHSPIYHQFTIKHVPVTQFDLEHSPTYASLAKEEREFLRSLHLGAYAPIIDEETLVGVLACGTKRSDAPFYERDLELLSTLANQTGGALRHARLVTDLQRLNDETRKLNHNLEEANVQMRKLDAVKSDFVTIASHELRTPLAQARGYIDIVDTLNEQGMLDQDQVRGTVDNLRKATERMEELIAAMLDVSQIDVNALDLNFAETTVESVVRMAVEPLTDAIRQRKLTLSVRGMKGLPPLKADLPRLVQAFRNVVLNAIKFTPDGGRIEATARLHKSENSDTHDAILVTITDTGVGINAENLELIFQKFYRGYDPSLHSTGTYKFMGAGPGLGLTIARGIIEAHGGKIRAESPGFDRETYPGSTFYIMLPLNPPESARKAMNLETVPSRREIQNGTR